MRLEISSATMSDRTCDRSQRIPVPEDTGKYATIGNSASLAPHSYHDSSATRNAWSTPVRLHILDQSRSTCSIGILGSQYHFQHSGLPHVCWKYLVSFKVHDARSERLMGQIVIQISQARFCGILRTVLESCRLQTFPFCGSSLVEITSSYGPPGGASHPSISFIAMWLAWPPCRQ
jgi:hypothetical protein